ncbi:MAG: DNA-processing protein DprA [Actinomycetota bacterium]
MRSSSAWWRDDRLARAAWTRLAEPGDVLVGAAVQVLGAGDALEHVLRDLPLPDAVLDALEGAVTRARLDKALQRWRTRLVDLAPQRDVATAERFGGRLVVPADAEWPERLDDLRLTTPVALWVVGPLALDAAVARSLAVVGSRASTAYGEHVAAEIGAGVAERGITVVSGAAFGIDAAAHRGALAAPGVTVAVLACGVDRYYPAAHEGLLRRIAADGLVVAEVPPGSTPMRDRFLQRNRLIAALAGGTVVVEAAWRSGALSTASSAAGLGRPLGAVPGPVTSAASAGCHRVLRDFGATCVTDAAEAAELVQVVGAGLPPEPEVPRAEHDGLSDLDVRVLDALPVRRGAPPSSLVRVAGLPLADVQRGLARLHLLGLAEPLRGDGERVWRRIRPAPAARMRPTPPSTELRHARATGRG